jgi:hypothetical protein
MIEYPLLIVLAFTMASKEPDFEKFVKKHDEAFTDWRERNSGDFKAYLDAKVLEFSTPKDIKALKKQVYLLALYKVKKEPPSEILREYSQAYEEMLRGLDMNKLTWQEMLDKIKSLDTLEKVKGGDGE